MGFWSNSSQTTRVRRSYRFLIESGISDEHAHWYWAKSVSLPNLSISENTYQLGNHVYKYPGIATWEDITISIVDESTRIKELYDAFVKGGYVPEIGDPELSVIYDDTVDGLGKMKSSESFTNGAYFKIFTLTDEGKPLDTWTLINPWIKQANFGELDYSSDDLLTVQLTISYDRVNYTNTTLQQIIQ